MGDFNVSYENIKKITNEKVHFIGRIIIYTKSNTNFINIVLLLTLLYRIWLLRYCHTGIFSNNVQGILEGFIGTLVTPFIVITNFYTVNNLL
ncbi:uncharacterized protein OCT59_003016 [Rhizophagus irregularis]|uniref:uncharacterized protein n=1 Tax=Rhizophagus irregularis TaxID=588596 RepID=UPI0033176867|nr:hypothetical protein OCT59_003016 [Rhizophagus irregularis]